MSGLSGRSHAGLKPHIQEFAFCLKPDVASQILSLPILNHVCFWSKVIQGNNNFMPKDVGCKGPKGTHDKTSLCHDLR